MQSVVYAVVVIFHKRRGNEMATKTREGVEQKPTFCRICEAGCGVLADTKDGKILKVRPNKNHVLSQGYMCIKASGGVDTTNDPDRVTRPLKRIGAPGEFEPCTWEEAIDDITQRLTSIRAEYGAHAFATYFASGGALNASAVLWYKGFVDALKVKWRYSGNHEDAATRIAANEYLYGIASPYVFVPDFWNTQFAIILGANPYVSHGSLFCEPQTKRALKDILNRDGRVVVVDPRQTETAKDFEHVGIRAGTDAYLLLGIIKTLVDESLIDHEFINEHVSGFDAFTSHLTEISLTECADKCRLQVTFIQQIARDFAAAESGVVYGRVGTCTQKYGTLNNFLQDVVMVMTGNLGKPGGFLKGWSPLPGSDSFNAPINQNPTRVRKHPDVAGFHPSTSLPADITTPGDGRVRALMTLGCNPMLNSPVGGPVLEAALEDLELHFSLDHYVTETNRHAHYVLPTTTMYERDDLPVTTVGSMLRPSIWATKPVAEKREQVREEWQILQEIAKKMGLGGAYSAPALRWLARVGIEPKPFQLFDLAVRTGPCGDFFGLRKGGINLRKLFAESGTGIKLKDKVPIQNISAVMKTADKKIQISPTWLSDEVNKLLSEAPDTSYPFMLVGRRELKSYNSFMHNSPTLWPDGRGQTAMLNPADAKAYGIENGMNFEITSRSGSITIPAQISTRVTRGHVVIPHGWGHNGGWSRANAAKGVSPNILTSSQVQDTDAITGGTILNGVPIRIGAIT